MNADESREITCPRCHALNNPGSRQCFLCDQPLSSSVFVPAPKGVAAAESVAAGPRPRFHVATILLFIALIAVALGIFREAPGIAIALVVPGGIALIRSMTLGGGRYGEPATLGDRIAAFLATFGLVVLVMVASGIAFFITCFAVCAVGGSGPRGGGVNEMLPLVTGGVAAVGVVIGLTYMIVRRSRQRSQSRHSGGGRY